jgi:uncharacterized protein (TIGR00251 family)
MEGLEVSERDGGVVFEVRVAPRSSRNEILGVHAGALKVALTAPPVEGAANEALAKLLAKRFGVAKRSVHILRGETGRVKTLRIDGITRDSLR